MHCLNLDHFHYESIDLNTLADFLALVLWAKKGRAQFPLELGDQYSEGTSELAFSSARFSPRVCFR